GGYPSVSSNRTCHLREDGSPAYIERFTEVLAFHEPGLAAVFRESQGWHITPAGIPAYSKRFARTFGFYEGRAAVISERGWRHIYPSGEDVYAAEYAWCGNYQE